MNIYVSNLGYDFREQDLNKLFSEFGEVTSAKVIIDKFTNKSKGFAFVEMPDDHAAATAIKELNGKLIEGRPVRISEARPREESPRRDNGGSSKRW
ncbi:MAG: RNA-binding protein [Filimonas sp.]|nr:RNA-binding protein [Filimonas sp.]